MSLQKRVRRITPRIRNTNNACFYRNTNDNWITQTATHKAMRQQMLKKQVDVELDLEIKVEY